jgi:hypothetical protein
MVGSDGASPVLAFSCQGGDWTVSAEWMQAFNRLVSQDECRNQGMDKGGRRSARQPGPPFPAACGERWDGDLGVRAARGKYSNRERVRRKMGQARNGLPHGPPAIAGRSRRCLRCLWCLCRSRAWPHHHHILGPASLPIRVVNERLGDRPINYEAFVATWELGRLHSAAVNQRQTRLFHHRSPSENTLYTKPLPPLIDAITADLDFSTPSSMSLFTWDVRHD